MAAIPLESDITKSIMRYLRTLRPGGWFVKVWGGGFQRMGLPDIIGVYRGRFVAFEVKRPKLGRPTQLQTATVTAINAAGGKAAFVTSLEDVMAIIDTLDIPVTEG